MSDLEVRQLRYFVAVAEELHFGRAADRLGMAQPPLSRAIRDLERQLGVTLLERTTRNVALTAAGEALLCDARTALDAVSAAEHRARNAGRPRPALRLALKADYDAGLLPGILAAFAREEAALPVELLMGNRGEQAPALRDGRADVALVWQPFDDRGIDTVPLHTESRFLAVAATDPLADKDSLYLADLSGRLLPYGSPAEEGNSSPPAGAMLFDLPQLLNLIELGEVVWFAPESVVRRHPRPGIAYRPVHDLTPSTMVVAWPRESRSPAVAAFVRTAVAVAGAAS
ncbi:LysR family transcriptional regulator [Virgisporangium aliadipatigenens]|uniref:LysR family transcriptional regulator n=1 Tax=Virgisporangium aliadipatigenens TaxID=741659 RepID=A0A8J4DPY9_9ACTN|nr:LysR substrate-binding domain-containing protein [Virgisporangium aliadipatigenens]GIJ46029.1 LysR family transcriptional regulator [Virgisporangium aliadipatigenens]